MQQILQSFKLKQSKHTLAFKVCMRWSIDYKVLLTVHMYHGQRLSNSSSLCVCVCVTVCVCISASLTVQCTHTTNDQTKQAAVHHVHHGDFTAHIQLCHGDYWVIIHLTYNTKTNYNQRKLQPCVIIQHQQTLRHIRNYHCRCRRQFARELIRIRFCQESSSNVNTSV